MAAEVKKNEDKAWLLVKMAYIPCVYLMMQKTFNSWPPSWLDESGVTYLWPRDLPPRGPQASAYMVQILKSLEVACISWERNYMIERGTGETSEVLEQIVKDWAQAETESIEREIVLAKYKRVLQRNEREQMVVQCHANLKAMARAKRASLQGIKHWADSKDIPKLEDLVGLDDQICRRVDVQTGDIEQYTIGQWLREGHFMTHSLLILGPAQYGKTPLCRALASVIAHALQTETQRPFFLQTGTTDSLRTVSLALTESVPLVLDDFTAASVARLTIDGLKHLLTCTGREMLEARFDDVALPEGPRIISSNATSPNEWLPLLPATLWTMTPEARIGMDPNALAVLKRMVVCRLSCPVVPQGRAKRHLQERAALGAAKIARLLAGAV